MVWPIMVEPRSLQKAMNMDSYTSSEHQEHTFSPCPVPDMLSRKYSMKEQCEDLKIKIMPSIHLVDNAIPSLHEPNKPISWAHEVNHKVPK